MRPRHRAVVLAVLTFACNRQQQDGERLLAEAVESYDQLKPRLAQVQATLSGLRAEVEELTVKVPGGAELRAKYFNADEVAGVLAAKMKWLSGQLASARSDLEKSRVSGLRDAVTRTAGEIQQVGAVSVELLHEKARLQRVAALFQAPYEHDLPTGYRVKAARDGIESRLIDFLDDASRNVATATWLEFDRLAFTDGHLAFPDSRSQLENVARILEAHPGVKLQIAARGDAQVRAQAVRQALVQAGVDAQRLPAVRAGKAPGAAIAALVVAR